MFFCFLYIKKLVCFCFLKKKRMFLMQPWAGGRVLDGQRLLPAGPGAETADTLSFARKTTGEARVPNHFPGQLQGFSDPGSSPIAKVQVFA